MTNNISLIKIKSFLSWRGLFPFCHSLSPFCHSRILFCHSREGGNPSFQSLRRAPSHVIARERSDRSNLNLSGFSLIELMVAVAILAIAILGIFHAYSVGFMGMADARDRTEAVNYIQKALEDYKNTPFKKIRDESMEVIQDTKFSIGSVVIDISETGEETYLKKIITQVRWSDRNEQIKIEEASTLIYSTQKTGVTLSASDIMLYASPYFRILPETFTTLTAEILDENGNTVTDWSGTINFTISGETPLGYLSNNSEPASSGTASVTYHSYAESIGIETIQASADLDDDGNDDVFDSIEIIISAGAEGIILIPASDSSLVGSSIDVDLYVVDASFDHELDGGSHIKPYDGQITLSASGPGNLSTTTISAPDGTANFTVNSNGTPGTVEITASALDLDLGYTEVTFTGGAQSIRLTSEDTSIYEGESATITITILDVNENPTPLNGTVTLSGGPFTEGEENTDLVFSGTELEDISRTFNETATITATGVTDGGTVLNSDTITINVLTSLQPAYIRLSAIPSNVKAGGTKDDYSKITATVYDAENNIVTNYSGTITFYTSLTGSFLDDDNVDLSDDLFDDSITLTPSDEGSCFLYLYSTSAGNTTIAAEPSNFAYYLDPDGGVGVEFYSEASGLRISASKGTVVANGVDFTEITVEIIDDSVPEPFVVSDYSGEISLTTDKGYFEGETGPGTITLSFANEGSKSINLYSDGIFGDATITAEANDTDAGFTATASTTVTFTEPQPKDITLTADPIERYSAGHGNDEYIKFYIEVTGSNISLNSMKISWDDSSSRTLEEIAIKSPDSETSYYPVKNTNRASSPHTENVSTTLYTGKSEIRLLFAKSIAGKTIEVIFYDNEEPSNSYPLTPPMQVVVPY